jgi:hypothetical protein
MTRTQTSASTVRIGTIAMAIGAALIGHVAVAAAQQPTPLPQLFNRIPKAPATSQEADKLVDWNSRSVAGIAALEGDLNAHDAAAAKIVEAANARINARVGIPTTAEQYAKGGAAAGIDMDRMQKDPAYAKEMQVKMKAMSPSELMAMATAMRQGMGMRATVAVYDPPDVKAAAEAGRALQNPGMRPAFTVASERRWADVAKRVAAIDAKFAPQFLKRPMCDGEGGGGPVCKAAEARWLAALPQQTQLMFTHDAEVLQVELAALGQERAALAEEVRTTDQHMLASQYGAASQEPGNPINILTLDAAATSHIGAMAKRFADIVMRHGEIAHCGQKKLLGTCWTQ